MKNAITAVTVLLFSLIIFSCQKENRVDNVQGTTTDSLLGIWDITDGYLVTHDIGSGQRDTSRNPADLAVDAYLQMDDDSSFLLYEQASSQVSGKFFIDASRVIHLLSSNNAPMGELYIRQLGLDDAILYNRMSQSTATTAYYYHWVLSR